MNMSRAQHEHFEQKKQHEHADEAQRLAKSPPQVDMSHWRQRSRGGVADPCDGELEYSNPVQAQNTAAGLLALTGPTAAPSQNFGIIAVGKVEVVYNDREDQSGRLDRVRDHFKSRLASRAAECEELKRPCRHV